MLTVLVLTGPPCSQCSTSGQSSQEASVTSGGGCSGSKRSMSSAVQRRKALYEPALRVKDPIRHQVPPPQVAGDEQDRFSRRSLLSFGSSTALLGLAAQPSQVLQFSLHSCILVSLGILVLQCACKLSEPSLSLLATSIYR